jgi:quercetin dioxygenase-like cupin family protein
MHPELRLIEDFMTDRGALNLPAQPRMLYVVRGGIAVGRRTIRYGEVLYSEETITAHAEENGATLWRFELSDPRTPAAKMNIPGVSSREKLVQSLTTLPEGELLWRGDSVAFPPGGCAYLHRHQGPGIRCVIDGELRVDTQGHSATYRIGEAWYEPGLEPVFAQATDRQTRFIRVMILPRALIGKSSIQYVNAEDKDKPKSQQYRVFVDAPLTWS